MPRFEPFCGIRYDRGVLAANGAGLDDVIAPPYDVTGASEREALSRRSPFNSVRVELPEGEGSEDRYQVARQLMSDWTAKGILRRDEKPCLYAYRMSHLSPDGQLVCSTGVIGGLEVAVPGEGDVIPHERTMPKPKGDRLDLLRACQANLSPVWGLSLAAGLSQAFAGSLGADPDAEAKDGDGVVHQLWKLADRGVLSAVSEAVASEPVVIADGHHRYETALAYRDERRRANGGKPGDYDLVMALVVELAEEQLSVRPIHRLLSGLPEGFDLVRALSVAFEIEPGAPLGPALLEQVRSKGAMGLATREGTWLLKARLTTVASAPDDLDSTLLDTASTGLPSHEVSYEAELAPVSLAVESGSADAAVLLKPVTVKQIASCADERRRMPPKTTYFWPKPRTGMVFRPVGD